MSTLTNAFLRLMIRTMVTAGFLILPVIPMVESPVTLMPISRNVSRSAIGIISAQSLVGVRHTATPWTLPVLSALAVSAFVCTRSLERQLICDRVADTGSNENHHPASE